MKLNFWQWLGLIILVIAGGYWIYERVSESQPDAPAAPAAVEPAG